MIIRKAQKKDIPFIVNAIIEIEKTNDNSNTFNNLFGCDAETTKNYLEQFFLDQENLDTELSLNTYIVAEIDNEIVGCCSLFYTNQNYYEMKSELFPIHLSSNHLHNFVETVKNLPPQKNISENKHFIEYIYTDKNYRGKSIARNLIHFQKNKINDKTAYINVLSNNDHLIQYYKKLGFEEYETIKIDEENNIYPCQYKTILRSVN